MRVGALVMLLAIGCYDSTWGERERSQRRNVQHYTPPTLTASRTSKTVQTFPVRIWATPKFIAQSIDWQKDARDLVSDANAVLEGDAGAKLEIRSMQAWDDGDRDEITAQHKLLHEKDDGKDVGWVIGLVGGFPTFTESFHMLGYADIVGKHLVVRASTDLTEAEAFTKALDEITPEERSHFLKERRRHRSVAVFLHEIAHTLGADHESAKDQLMMPSYAWTMTGFSPATVDILRAGIAHRNDPDPKPAVEPQPKAVEVPAEIAASDRKSYLAMVELVGKQEWAEAFEAGRPLFSAYPNVYALQDLHCQIAMQLGLDWQDAKKECAPLMKLAHPNRR